MYTQPDATGADPTMPMGTPSGPYALTPAMIAAIRAESEPVIRVIALSWGLTGVSRGGSTEVGEHTGKLAVEHARRFEAYLRNSGR